MDKIERNELDKKTGLTPIQEQFALLLISGKKITEISKLLNISRNTLYSWQEQSFFRAYFNRLGYEVKQHTYNRLFSLCDEAIKALEKGLKSKNESIQLKSASYIIDNINKLQILGAKTPKDAIKNELEAQKIIYNGVTQIEIEKEMKKNGIE